MKRKGTSRTKKAPVFRKKAKLFLQSEEGKITRGHALSLSAALMMLGGSVPGESHADTGHDAPADGLDTFDAALHGTAVAPVDGTEVAHCSHG